MSQRSRPGFDPYRFGHPTRSRGRFGNQGYPRSDSTSNQNMAQNQAQPATQNATSQGAHQSQTPGPNPSPNSEKIPELNDSKNGKPTSMTSPAKREQTQKESQPSHAPSLKQNSPGPTDLTVASDLQNKRESD